VATAFGFALKWRAILHESTAPLPTATFPIARDSLSNGEA
jgi:hypothetical protein